MSVITAASTSLYGGFKRGILSLPGATHASKETARQLLSKDAAEHHCYFRGAGMHNHLSHQYVVSFITVQFIYIFVSVLAAYDLGASAGLLKKKYEEEASYQRPIYVEEKDKSIIVTQDNWVQYLGNQR